MGFIENVNLISDWLRSGGTGGGVTSGNVVDTTLLNQADPEAPKSIAYFQLNDPGADILIGGVCKFTQPMTITSDLVFSVDGKFDVCDVILSNTVYAGKHNVFATVPSFSHYVGTFNLEWIKLDSEFSSTYSMNRLKGKLLGGKLLLSSIGDIELDNRVSIYDNNVTIDDVDFVAIARDGSSTTRGELRMYGSPMEDATKPLGFLSEDASAGDTRLYITEDSYNNAVTVDEFYRIRGENDVNCTAIHYQDFKVTAKDEEDGKYYIDVSEALDYDYLVSYPDTDCTNGTDWTTITEYVSSLTEAEVHEATVDIPVSSTDRFRVGDMVALYSDATIGELAPTEFVNTIEVYRFFSKVVAIDADSDTVVIEHPTTCDYPLVGDMRLIVFKPVVNSHFNRCTMRYDAPSVDTLSMAFQASITEDCTINNIVVYGAGGLRGHGVSLRDSIRSSAHDIKVLNPMYGDSGQGYGASFYSCTASSITKLVTSGCRHSLLFFKNSCYNISSDIVSNNCGISDIDFHGANSNNNLVTDVIISGGQLACNSDGFTTVHGDGAYRKSFIKFGNPKHIFGDSHNVVSDVVANGYPQGVDLNGIQLEVGGIDNQVLTSKLSNVYRGVVFNDTSYIDDAVPQVGFILSQSTISGVRDYTVYSTADKVFTFVVLDCKFLATARGAYLLHNTKGIRFVNTYFDKPTGAYDALVFSKTQGLIEFDSCYFLALRLLKIDTESDVDVNLRLRGCRYEDYDDSHKLANSGDGEIVEDSRND